MKDFFRKIWKLVRPYKLRRLPGAPLDPAESDTGKTGFPVNVDAGLEVLANNS